MTELRKDFGEEMKKIIVFGAGEKGKVLTRMLDGGVIPGLSNYEIVAFCDNYKPSGSFFHKRPIIKPKDIAKYPDAAIVISSDKILDEAMRQLLDIDINNEVYYFPEYAYRFKWKDYMPLFVPMDIHKPRLPYLEISIFAKCNLNCRGCSAASNIAKPWRMTADELEKQFCALKKKFSGIRYLKLFGGEPILNPELTELVECSRRFWPDAEIVVHSNGILVPEMDAEVLKNMEQCDVSFVFTLYPETGRRQRSIEQRLGEFGVDYIFRKPVYQFYKQVNPKGDYDAAEVYKSCEKCVNLRDGRLAPCAKGWLLEILESRYGVSICRDKHAHTVNISDTTLDGWEINKLLDSPFNLCSYCAFMRYNEWDVSQAYDWEPNACGVLEDWLIDE